MKSLFILALACPAISARLGASRDDNGCLTSAGYVYCAEKDACLRPWEETCGALEQAGNTKASQSDSKNSATLLGESTNDCLLSAGYQYCEELDACVRYWETDDTGTTYQDLCPSLMAEMEEARRSLLLGGTKDENGCYSSAGYSWCESSSKCIRSWEEDCAGGEAETTVAATKLPLLGGGKDANDCCRSLSIQ